MRRIALSIFAADSFGGAERRLIRIVNEIAKRNGQEYQFDLHFHGCSLEAAKKIIEKADCNVAGIRNIYASENMARCLFRIISRKYDVIHFFDSSNYNDLLNKLCGFFKRKRVFSVCSYLDAKGMSSERLNEITKRILRTAEHIDLLYPIAENEIRPLTANNTLSITPGTFTDLKVFCPKEKQKWMIFAARLEKPKNPELVVNAAIKCAGTLRKEGYTILILGKGEQEKELKDRIEENLLDDIVVFKGYSQTSQYFPSAEAVFSVQILDNYPSQTLAESIASGCYSFITDLGNSRLCATEDIASFVQPNTDSLAEAMIMYMKLDDTEKHRIMMKAREFAEKNYCIDRSVEYFSEIYRSL